MESPTVTTTRLTVRFEDSCVLIPPSDPTKPGLRPRLVRKSYSLPLWKTTPTKKTVPAPVTPESDAADGDKGDRKSFSVTVSVPRLTIKSKPRRPSLPPSPCLSKRNPGSPTSPVSSPALEFGDFSPSPLLRTPTFPAIQPANLREAATVPLRPCCEACHSCVDAALAEGSRWAERWSSGAKRRYSEGEHAKLHTRPIFGATREFTITGPNVPLATALQVDEVEVKRRSSDPQGDTCVHEDVVVDSDEEAPLSPMLSTLMKEDEDLLFPLPSPRRSPSPSPHATPLSGSQVSLNGIQTVLDMPPTRSESSPLVTVSVSGSLPVVSTPPASTPLPKSNVPECPSNDSPVASPTSMPEANQPDRRSPVRQPSAAPPHTPRSRGLSFGSASGSLIKGSAAMLKGVAASVTGATMVR